MRDRAGCSEIVKLLVACWTSSFVLHGEFADISSEASSCRTVHPGTSVSAEGEGDLSPVALPTAPNFSRSSLICIGPKPLVLSGSAYSQSCAHRKVGGVCEDHLAAYRLS